jgi:hypothetical protein
MSKFLDHYTHTHTHRERERERERERKRKRREGEIEAKPRYGLKKLHAYSDEISSVLNPLVDPVIH